MAASHPFTFPQAGAAAPKAPTAPAPAAPPPPAPVDDFFDVTGSAGSQKLPYVTPGKYPRLRIDSMKRFKRFKDGEKTVAVQFTVVAPSTKTDPLGEPLLEGMSFSQLFFIRHSPAFSSLANLLACAFNVPAKSVTKDTLQQLMPQMTMQGDPPAPCPLNDAGVEVSALFFQQSNSEFCGVNWGAVPGRAYPDVMAASAAQG